VPNHTTSGPFPSIAPDMNAFDVSALDGLAGRYHFCVVRICSRKVRDPLHMIADRVVRLEPSGVGSKTG
jgi:hypothetical protein